jgi:DNA-binding NarL/FixJ family response regulator
MSTPLTTTTTPATTTVAGRAELSTVMRQVTDLPGDVADAADHKRRLLVEVCKVFGEHVGAAGDGPGAEFGLPPRLRQTLTHLVRGDSEKEVANRLGLSQHTIHVYVKQLYKRLKVNSRAELLAKFVRGPGRR